tara:strand:+ start:251 stop:799 length:549 start_codon:yes stop_codon:yes gene_type:complete
MQKIANEDLGRLGVDEFKSSAKCNAVLILDSVRSLNNVGSAFRTSDAFAVEHLYLAGITGTPPHREIEKSALGATESVVWSHHPDIVDLLKNLKSQGYLLVAVEQVEGGQSLELFQPPAHSKVAFVFGNEVFGVSDEAIALCDIGLEVPQFGTKHSLNISVCIGVVLWDFMSKVGIAQLKGA